MTRESVWILTADMFGPDEFEIMAVYASKEAAEQARAQERDASSERYKITEHIILLRPATDQPEGNQDADVREL